MMRWHIFITLVLLGLLIFLMPSFAHDWLTGYKNKSGISCCNETDCRPLVRGMTVRLGEKIIVFPGGNPTTITIIHPSMDPEGRTWVCTTGCAFVAGMS